MVYFKYEDSFIRIELEPNLNLKKNADFVVTTWLKRVEQQSSQEREYFNNYTEALKRVCKIHAIHVKSVGDIDIDADVRRHAN